MVYFKSFIYKNFINLDKFVLEYSKKIGLVNDQAFFISLLLQRNINYERINLSEFVEKNSSNFTKSEAENISAELYNKKILDLTLENNNIYLNLSNLISIFEKWFITPSNYSSIKDKLIWTRFHFNIDFELSDDTLIELINKDFNKVIHIVNTSNSNLEFNDLIMGLENLKSSRKSFNNKVEQVNIKQENLNSTSQKNKENVFSVSDFDEEEFLMKELKKDKVKFDKLVQKNWLEDL